MADEKKVAAPNPDDACESGEGGRSGSSSSWRGALVGGVIGMVAAGLSSMAIKSLGDVFQLSSELSALAEGMPSAEDLERLASGKLALSYQNSVLWLATTGSILGLLLGLATGVLRGPRASLPVRGASGCVLGAVFAGIAGLLAVYIDQSAKANLPAGQTTVSEIWTLLMHGTTWLVVGLGVGLGIGMAEMRHGRRSVLDNMIVAGIAGLLGGAMFPILAAIAMPLTNTSLPIPLAEDHIGRLLWLALPSAAIGLALGMKREPADTA